MTTDELLAACDVALMRSKRQGKGRVTSASAAQPASGAARRSRPAKSPLDASQDDNGLCENSGAQATSDPAGSPGRPPMSQNSFDAKDTLEVGGRRV